MMQGIFARVFCGVCLVAMASAAGAVSCKSFATHAQAQAYFNAKKPGYKRLDRDKDGSACDCLPGGNGTKCPKKWQ